MKRVPFNLVELIVHFNQFVWNIESSSKKLSIILTSNPFPCFDCILLPFQTWNQVKSILMDLLKWITCNEHAVRWCSEILRLQLLGSSELNSSHEIYQNRVKRVLISDHINKIMQGWNWIFYGNALFQNNLKIQCQEGRKPPRRVKYLLHAIQTTHESRTFHFHFPIRQFFFFFNYNTYVIYNFFYTPRKNQLKYSILQFTRLTSITLFMTT